MAEAFQSEMISPTRPVILAPMSIPSAMMRYFRQFGFVFNFSKRTTCPKGIRAQTAYSTASKYFFLLYLLTHIPAATEHVKKNANSDTPVISKPGKFARAYKEYLICANGNKLDTPWKPDTTEFFEIFFLLDKNW